MSAAGKVAICGAIMAYIIYLFLTRQDIAVVLDEIHEIVYMTILILVVSFYGPRKRK